MPPHMRPLAHPSPLEGYEDTPPLPTGLTLDGRTLDNFIPGQEYKRSKAYDEFVDPIDNKGNGFDFHIYYMHTLPVHLNYARQLHERIRREFPELRIHPMEEHPMGPHPTGSFQVDTFNPHETGTLMTWLVIHRGPLSVLIHPNTDDELRSHTEHATWIGERWPLNSDLLEHHRHTTLPRSASLSPSAPSNLIR
ncbi:DOPA-like domain-containing protein [Lentinula detonsa]|uniref:DOPA-like domain-containing protein n=1 Tax=Lentinula detonsa TaxID=2804962 RepID=A0A9W8NRZ9_9AGAR|nr:DOPA-like domain-containing protein [Lentinula detonsa]